MDTFLATRLVAVASITMVACVLMLLFRGIRCWFQAKNQEDGATSPNDTGANSNAQTGESPRRISQQQVVSEDGKKNLLPSEFELPFHVNFFADASPFQVALFVLYAGTIGPVVLGIRLLCVFCLIPFLGPEASFSKWFLAGVLGRYVQSFGETEIPNDGRPVVFLTCHHVTFDVGDIGVAVRRRFALNAKVMAHKKVYNSSVMKHYRHFLVTTQDPKITSFYGIFQEWASSCRIAYTQDRTLQRDALIIAPAGMTTHSHFVTPMYWKYFVHPDTVKVLVNVETTNPFGVNLRNLSMSFFMGEIFSIMMPWTRSRVTFHSGIVPDNLSDGTSPLKSQKDVDQLIKCFFLEMHNKKFASAWTNSARQRMDKYLAKGEYVRLSREDEVNVINICRRQNGLTHEEALSSEVFSDNDTENKLFPTHSLIHNPEARSSQGHNLVLVNPVSLKDELLAAAFEIPMYQMGLCSKFNEVDSHVSTWWQGVSGSRIAVLLGKFMHYALIERNLVLLGTLLLASGLWSNAILLCAQYVALAHFPLLLIKLLVSRARPVWLPLSVPVKSFVAEVQADGSFPSGHTAFLSLLFAVATFEPALFSLQSKSLMAVLTVVTGWARVQLGAHFLTDVVAGFAYSMFFVYAFLAFSGDAELLDRTLSSRDLAFSTYFTLALVIAQVISTLVVNSVRYVASPLTRESYLHNNLSRIVQAQQNTNTGEGISEITTEDMSEETNAIAIAKETTPRPLGPSLDFLAPILSVGAVAFWARSMLANIFLGLGFLPRSDAPAAARFFGAITTLAYIGVVVLPLRKLIGEIFLKSHILRMLLLAVLYTSLNVVAAVYCQLLIQAIVVIAY